MGVATSFDGLVVPTVLVVGDAFELEAVLPAGARLLRVLPSELSRDPVPIALAILDARSHAVDLLANLRRSPRLATVPTLVVTEDADAPELAVLGADDIVSPPFGRSDVVRRVRTLLELGRTRFTLWFAQQALEHSVSGLTIGDRSLPDTPLAHATTVFEKITGYSPAEVRGRGCRFLQGPATDPAARATLRNAIRDQRRAQVTLLNYKKDGTPFWNEVTVFPVRTPDGQPLQWVGGVQHDVTPLVEARAEVDRLFTLLLQRQAFNQSILDGVDVGIVTTDMSGRVTFVNRCAREILRREGALDGTDVRELLALGERQTILPLQQDERFSHTLHAGDAEIVIDLEVSRADEAMQEHLGFFFIFHDRTQDKQLEMERRRFERLAAMGTMVAGFAHEVRNPMASLRSIAESLNDELVEAGVKLPHVDRMLRVIERVEGLVRTSLLFGRPSPPRASSHRPWMILSAAVSTTLPRTRQLGGDLPVEADPELPDVYVDDGQIVQVLVVLINNALDATGSPRRVLVRVRHGRVAEGSGRRSEPPPSSHVRFEVRDDGPGIAPENIGRIFDPFFTTKAEGLGLGLSIAQQLVTENGGRIELTSPAGGPTVFTMLLPTTPR